LEKSINQVFIEWVEYLKEAHGVTYSDISKRMDWGRFKITNLKRGGTSVSESDLRALVLCYPVLRTKAHTVGINPDPSTEEFKRMPEELQREHKSSIELENKHLSELLELERRRIEYEQNRNERNEKRIDEMFERIEQLMRILELERRK